MMGVQDLSVKIDRAAVVKQHFVLAISTDTAQQVTMTWPKTRPRRMAPICPKYNANKQGEKRNLRTWWK